MIEPFSMCMKGIMLHELFSTLTPLIVCLMTKMTLHPAMHLRIFRDSVLEHTLFECHLQEVLMPDCKYGRATLEPSLLYDNDPRLISEKLLVFVYFSRHGIAQLAVHSQHRHPFVPEIEHHTLLNLFHN